jgi:hypothetical protein
MARVAVASGTATAVSNRVSRRQASRWADQGQGAPAYLSEQPAPQAPPAQQAPPPPAADPIAQLKQLGELHEQGVLTDEEFAAQKAKILG